MINKKKNLFVLIALIVCFLSITSIGSAVNKNNIENNSAQISIQSSQQINSVPNQDGNPGMTTYEFYFNLGPDYAGRKYAILGSMSGTEPGTPLPGIYNLTLPLNWDWFTDFVVANWNSPMFENFIGTLDVGGETLAYFNIYGGVPPEYVGTTVYFALALYDPFDYVTDPVIFQLE